MLGNIYRTYETGEQEVPCYHCNGTGLDYDYEKKKIVQCGVCWGDGYLIKDGDRYLGPKKFHRVGMTLLKWE